MNSNGCRSDSAFSSTNFSTSHATLVGKDNQLVVKDTYEALSSRPQKHTWLDHLLVMFCVKWPKASKTPEEPEFSPSTWPSPWILPIHVLANQDATSPYQITKIAKCTIDTGNMQGNIVSRNFVETVLGFSTSSFMKLTKEEEMSGTGITGDSHIPQGAIFLTWYHKNSTRVFRDMRFLISPTQYCDIIIGARSIQTEKILSVPCLPVGDVMQTAIGVDEAEDREWLRVKHWEKRGEVQKKANRRKEIEQDPDDFEDDALDDLNREEPVVKDEERIYELTLKIWDITHKGGKENTPEQKRQDCDPLWEKINSTYQSEVIKQKLPDMWNYLWEKLGHEGKRSMPITSSTWTSGASTGDGTSGLYYRA